MHFSSLTYQKQLPYKSQITSASTPLMRSSSFCVHLIKQCSPIFTLLAHFDCLFEAMGSLSGAERLNSLVKDHTRFISSPIPKAFIPPLHHVTGGRHTWHDIFSMKKYLSCVVITSSVELGANELPNQNKPSLVL